MTSFENIDFDLGFGPMGRLKDEQPFCILVLGDFSGRSSRGLVDPEIAERKVPRVDRDELDRILEGFGAQFRIALDGSEDRVLNLVPKDLDDLRPERLLRRVPFFKELRQLRERLEDPASFDEAAAEVRAWSAEPKASEETPEPDQAGEQPESADEARDLMEDMLSAQPRSADDAELMPLGLETMVRDAVREHLLPNDPPDADLLLERVDAAIGAQLKLVLHSPDFQALEASWRGLALLVDRLETDEKLRLHVLDVSKEELAADLLRDVALPDTETCRRLATSVPNDAPWSLIVDLHEYDATREDGVLVGRIGSIAAAAGAPHVASASPALVGCERGFGKTADPRKWEGGMDEETAGTWAAVRSVAEASWSGLTLPRFLLRRPYGAATDPVDGPAFEELGEKPRHAEYLWAPGGLAVAVLLGECFARDGWDLDPSRHRDFKELPTHVYGDEFDREMKPCAEAWLTDDTVELLVESGFIVLQSVRDSPSLRVPALRSIALPAATLSGRWQA